MALHDRGWFHTGGAVGGFEGLESNTDVLHFGWDGRGGDSKRLDNIVLFREDLNELGQLDAVVQINTDILDTEVVVIQLGLLVCHMVAKHTEVLSEVAFAFESLARKFQQHVPGFFERGVGVEQARVAFLYFLLLGHVQEKNEAQELFDGVHLDFFFVSLAVQSRNGGVRKFRCNVRAAQESGCDKLCEPGLLLPGDDTECLAVGCFQATHKPLWPVRKQHGFHHGAETYVRARVAVFSDRDAAGLDLGIDLGDGGFERCRADNPLALPAYAVLL